jgi:hypothetical protein
MLRIAASYKVHASPGRATSKIRGGNRFFSAATDAAEAVSVSPDDGDAAVLRACTSTTVSPSLRVARQIPCREGYTTGPQHNSGDPVLTDVIGRWIENLERDRQKRMPPLAFFIARV